MAINDVTDNLKNVKVKIKFVDEFRNFVTRGNVVDMAVGIIIGAAFGKIVTSLVADIIMPPIGYLIGGVDFTGLHVAIGEAVKIEYGKFLQTLFDFIVTAFAIFLIIKVMNRVRSKQEAQAKPEPPAEPTPTKEELLLTEIRDLLKNK